MKLQTRMYTNLTQQPKPIWFMHWTSNVRFETQKDHSHLCTSSRNSNNQAHNHAPIQFDNNHFKNLFIKQSKNKGRRKTKNPLASNEKEKKKG